jgi:hypothetical protein
MTIRAVLTINTRQRECRLFAAPAMALCHHVMAITALLKAYSYHTLTVVQVG